MEQELSELSLENDFKRDKIGLPHRGLVLLIGSLLLLVAAIAVLVILMPKKNTMPCFSEVMTSNHKAFDHPVYGTVDWVEIYNPTDKDIDLSGYGFSTEIKHPFRYRFPDGTVLKPGEFLVLYCTGGTAASDDDPYCTGFNLSASGEQLFLVTPSKVEADEVFVPALDPDTAYARTDKGDFQITIYPTPWKANRFE